MTAARKIANPWSGVEQEKPAMVKGLELATVTIGNENPGQRGRAMLQSVNGSDWTSRFKGAALYAFVFVSLFMISLAWPSEGRAQSVQLNTYIPPLKACSIDLNACTDDLDCNTGATDNAGGDACVTPQTCAEDRFLDIQSGGGVQCTADDVKLASPDIQPVGNCSEGDQDVCFTNPECSAKGQGTCVLDVCSSFGDTARVAISLDVIQNSESERDDIGIYLGLNGLSAVTGRCSISTIPLEYDPDGGVPFDPTKSDLNGELDNTQAVGQDPFGYCGNASGTMLNGDGSVVNSSSPSLTAPPVACTSDPVCQTHFGPDGLNASDGPFTCQEFGNGITTTTYQDSCGDLVDKQVLSGVNLGIVEFTCIDQNGDGLAEIPTCTTWRQPGDKPGLCMSPLAAVAGAPSKCRCEDLTLPLAVPKTIEVIKDLNPASDAGRFTLQVVQNTGTTEAANVGDTGTTGAVPVTGLCQIDENVCNTSIDCEAGDTKVEDGDFCNPLDPSVGEVDGTSPSTDTDNYNSSIACVETIGSCSGNSAIPCSGDQQCVDLNAGSTCNIPTTPVAVCGGTGEPSCGSPPTISSVPVPDNFPSAIQCTVINAPKPGTVKITKITVGGIGTFAYTGTLTTSADIGTVFDGSIDGVASPGTTEQATNVKPGSYTAIETAKTGWDLTALTCDDLNSVASLGTATATYNVEAGETVECTFTNTKRGMVTLLKTTQGISDPNAVWNFTLTGPGVDTTDSTPPALMDFGGVKLIAGAVYELCEIDIPGGWTTAWMGDGGDGGAPDTPIIKVFGTDTSTVDGTTRYSNIYDPGYVPPPETYVNTKECVKFTVNPGETRQFSLDNSFPGGEPRTIGYWKNWSSCSGGQQYANAVANGGAAAGYATLDELLASPGYTIGILELDEYDCLLAHYILDKREISGRHKKKASDAAYNLAAQLLAAMLNDTNQAQICQAATNAINAGQALLAGIGFDGDGHFLRPKDGQDYQDANALAATLDQYNNGSLCNGG